jgi:transketolase
MNPPSSDSTNFTELAKAIRRDILNLCFKTGSSHIGSSFSIVEILTILYFKSLNISPETAAAPDRDRFILSKGHGCPALYATLRHRGFIGTDIYEGFARDSGTLEQHPTRNLEWGIECSTGSLGHGLSVGAGMALAGKRDKREYRVFVLLSDGETNEGSTWEAAMFAAQHGLDNLVAVIDYNKMQALGKTEEVIQLDPYAEKWESFGWRTVQVNGHDIGELTDAFDRIPFSTGKPSCLIAHTVKGKGVCFMEDDLLWHYRCPDQEEFEKAICELE